jgi:glutamine amidotransferase
LIAVIDINISNIGSVMEAFQRIGLKTQLTSAAADVTKANAIILPGVGSFRDGMARLGELGLVEPLRSATSAGKPIFGICLGMQLMAETGEEFGTHKGLGLLPGSVVRLPEEPTVRIPNIGWCDVEPTRASTLFPEDAPTRSFYFVHSYHLMPSDPKVTSAVVKTGKSDIVAAIEHKNLSAVQFHPEKSQDAGLDLLGRLAAKVGAFA